MEKSVLIDNLRLTTIGVLNAGRDSCINTFSNNIKYFITDINPEVDDLSFNELLLLKNRDYAKGIHSFDEIVDYIHNKNDVCVIDFILFKSKRRCTYVQIVLVKQLRGQKIDLPIFHAAVPAPQSWWPGDEKFDINWQVKPLMIFYFRLKYMFTNIFDNKKNDMNR